LQFTDSTAVSLGYKNSLDLVNKNPTIEDQLFVVETYLSRFKPFSGKLSLYMAVFYPPARSWNKSKLFPESVRAVNPGINTPGDYIRFVDGNINTLAIIPLIGGSIVLYLLLNRKAEQ